MLTEDTKDLLRQQVRTLHTHAGFRPRAAQGRMIAEIARTLAGESGKRVIAVEAGTGTGKSVGYLLPALALAAAEKKTVVVATATLALQEQLALRDLPLLIKTLGLDIQPVLAKGRSRWLCPRNLAAASGTDPAQVALDLGGDALPHAVFPVPPTPEDREQLGKLAAAWEAGTFNGDLDQWPTPLSGMIQRGVSTTRHGCSGRACRYHSACPAMKARAATLSAQVVVTNHAQLLADLAMGGGVALPDLANVILVVDEAHHLPATAISATAATVPLTKAQTWLRAAATALARTFRALPPGATQESLPAEAQRAIDALRDGLEWIDGALAHRLPPPAASPPESAGAKRDGARSAPHTHTFVGGLWPDMASKADTLRGYADELAAGFEKVRRAWSRAVREGKAKEATAGPQVTALAPSAERVDQIRALLKLWGRTPDPGAPPTAIWVTREGGEWLACGSPIEAASFLREQLIDRAHGVVLTSATLTTLGTFEHFARQMGLSTNDGTRLLALRSPFDLEQQGEIVVPGCAVDPRAEAEHSRAIAETVEAHDPALGGLLVLFTSRAQLELVYRGLKARVRKAVQRQGETPRALQLSEHARRVERGELAILMGLNAFAEGIDLPGRLCASVLIARLPFGVPEDPIELTRKAWIEARGGNYFAEVAMPACALRLTQACGRLIRTETDSGRILVLDRRLTSTRYGREILAGLPGFRRRLEPPGRPAGGIVTPRQTGNRVAKRSRTAA